MIEVIPSILARTTDELYEAIRKLEPHVSRVHIDIVDGQFAPNTTVTAYQELDQLDTQLKFDVHLMVNNPGAVLEHWYQVKQADRFFIHAEAPQDPLTALAQIRAPQRWAGLAANPGTNVPTIERFLPSTDIVLMMGVHPGFTGGHFLPATVEKVATLHARHPQLPIGVDGGMSPETAQQVIAAGATIIVSSTYIMQSPDIGEAVEKLKNS